jgi:hypothetical protein
MKYRTSQPGDLDHQPPRTARKCAPLRHEKKKKDRAARTRQVERKEDANSMKEHAEEEEEEQEEYEQQNEQPDIPHHTATSSRECNLYA